MSGVKMLTHALLALSKYHPVVIEGMGNYDPRAAATVASNVHAQLRRHWSEKDPRAKDARPKLIITQGDPLSARGVSAITPAVATLLGAERGLVCLDPEIASYHAPNADRDNVILEMRYSELVAVLEMEKGKGIVRDLEAAVDRSLQEKNARRKYLGKPPLKDYFRDFALLQEVTKAACLQICGDITVAHTAQDISEFSVTSFYRTGLELGLVGKHHMVPYVVEDDLDFEKIDRR
mmetsp:Transcript_32327/g.50024  ORF Transcript_32327/g.50024 Transcript_32327/m.50024 type:complete len:235 (+) Transcript_32327:103-807(+)|eukprot:CAMPEP_0194291440 /NCGR_PEP_ID=MMETSP0169-20130528/43388_1 /TAXON_ID=218684 /ORGANISM="Corethron pennatum, Strain L29A3" /LENGTH=234 /DNA_ID=CAMNT_0039039319 /DNA_START=30 /DNA_END=737 /DNA_ORIENTATION=+